MVTYSDSDFEVIETPSPPKRMSDEGGLSALVSNPEAQPRLSAVEREAAERQRDRERREQGMQMLETDALRSDENSLIDLSKAGEALSGIWEDMPWYDRAALSTALVPIVGDVVVVQLRGDSCLILEHANEGLVVGQVSLDALDDDEADEIGVLDRLAGEVDLRHPSHAEALEQHIVAVGLRVFGGAHHPEHIRSASITADRRSSTGTTPRYRPPRACS